VNGRSFAGAGAILTKLDGDTRGGAALSVRGVSGKPIKVTSTHIYISNDPVRVIVLLEHLPSFTLI
jgi:hypothetical protein